ncbi:acyl-CoA dehydrogenase family protein [Streptomyces sp. NPDC003635]
MSADRAAGAVTDLPYSDVEEELRSQLQKLLRQRYSGDGLVGRVETEEAHDTGLWRALAGELGVVGLAVPEELGGAGATWRETALVLEELGAAVAPVPYLGHSVVATAALLAAGDVALLPDIAAGQRIAALAVPFTTLPDGEPSCSVKAADGTASGTVTGVADASAADVLLVPAAGPAGALLLSVDLAGAGRSVRRTPVVSLDLTRPLTDFELRDAPCAVIATGTAAQRAVRQALVAGAALLASEQLGVAEWCLATTVAYAKQRHQFARPIGSFQVVKHRLADLWILVTQARAVARNAAVALAADSADAPTEAALAQAFVSEVVVKVAEEALQLHGGIGFTWEHPIHLYLKRAKSSSLAFGTADRNRALLSGLVDLPPAVGRATV